MNEQLIDKALYESGLTAQGCWDEFDDYAKQCIEKFGELLVKECAAQCTSTLDYNTILKHFGIKQ